MATNITDKSTLKGWFKRGLKPIESQFAAWMDSYWHKNEFIPTKSIEGLEDVLNKKAESADIDNINDILKEHIDDDTRHKTEAEQGKLNNLADNPNYTYATKEELLAQGAIIIPVDFTVTDRDILDDIKQLVRPLIDDGSFWKKPVYANYIWKTSYTEGVVAEDRSVLIPATSFQGNSIIGYEFLSDIEVIDAYADVPAACKYTLSVYIRGSSVNARLENRIYKTDKTIFLVEDGDNIVVSSDRDSGMSVFSSAWTEFYTALKNKLTPTIYLKTNNTDVFIPASYYLTKDSYDGVIRIEYVKDGQLWIEDRKFVLDSGGGMGGHGSIISETTVQKIPIGDNPVYVLNVDLSMTAANPEIIEEVLTAHQNGKGPILLVHLNVMGAYMYPSFIRFEGKSIQAYYSNNILSKNKISDSLVNKYTINELYLTATTVGGCSCNIKLSTLSLNDWDYMKASNIHVVTEYPTDLSAYPDGSIFIKTVS